MQQPDQIVKKQLTARLTKLRQRIATLTAEVEMTEHYLANVEQRAVRPTLKLRKNSTAKWSLQGQVRRYLSEHNAPIKAQTLFNELRRIDPSLKSSTFRSHLKRMVDAGVITREGSRGYYQLTRKPDEVQIEDRESVRRVHWVKHSIYER